MLEGGRDRWTRTRDCGGEQFLIPSVAPTVGDAARSVTDAVAGRSLLPGRDGGRALYRDVLHSLHGSFLRCWTRQDWSESRGLLPKLG